jgi:hypothetical protein
MVAQQRAMQTQLQQNFQAGTKGSARQLPRQGKRQQQQQLQAGRHLTAATGTSLFEQREAAWLPTHPAGSVWTVDTRLQSNFQHRWQVQRSRVACLLMWRQGAALAVLLRCCSWLAGVLAVGG